MLRSHIVTRVLALHGKRAFDAYNAAQEISWAGVDPVASIGMQKDAQVAQTAPSRRARSREQPMNQRRNAQCADMKATTKPAKLHHTATCDDRACSRGAVTKCSACWLEQRGTCTYGTSALSPTFDKAQMWSARWRKGRHRARSAMMPRRTVAHTTRRFAALAGRCRPLKRT